MSRRDQRFILRVITLCVLSLTLSLGVVVLLQNSEIEKLAPSGGLRDLLMIASPLLPISILNFHLAMKSFGNRSVLTEVFLIAGAYILFLAMVLSFYFGAEADNVAENCRLWIFICEEGPAALNWHLGIILFLIGVGLILSALHREGLIRRPST